MAPRKPDQILCHSGTPGLRHWGDPLSPPGHQQGRFPTAGGPSPARLIWGPRQTSPGVEASTNNRRAGTQPRRERPALQRGSATQAVVVSECTADAREQYPCGERHSTRLGSTQSCRPKEGACRCRYPHGTTCGDTLPPGTTGLGGRDTAFS